MTSDPLLDRAALGAWLCIGPRSVSRFAQLCPPDLLLPGGRPRWRQETVERALQRMSRTRRRRTLPERGTNGCFVSINDETDVGRVGSSNSEDNCLGNHITIRETVNG